MTLQTDDYLIISLPAKDSLSLPELCERIPDEEQIIRHLMHQDKLVQGTHCFKPHGSSSRGQRSCSRRRRREITEYGP